MSSVWDAQQWAGSAGPLLGNEAGEAGLSCGRKDPRNGETPLTGVSHEGMGRWVDLLIGDPRPSRSPPLE